MGYLSANFSLPGPLCSRVRLDVRDRQTDRRQTKASLNASTLRGRRHNKGSNLKFIRPTSDHVMGFRLLKSLKVTRSDRSQLGIFLSGVYSVCFCVFMSIYVYPIYFILFVICICVCVRICSMHELIEVNTLNK